MEADLFKITFDITPYLQQIRVSYLKNIDRKQQGDK